MSSSLAKTKAKAAVSKATTAAKLLGTKIATGVGKIDTWIPITIEKRAYYGVLISIIIALCVSISYMSGGPKLPSEQQKNKDKVINRLVSYQLDIV